MVKVRTAAAAESERCGKAFDRACPICGGRDHESIYEHKAAPIYQLIRTADTITDDLFSQLSIVFCRECGHMFNRTYQAELSQRMYGDVALTNVPVHVSMVDSLRSIAAWIGEKHYAGGAVIEIGAGSGHLSRILAQQAKSVVVYEPCTGLRPHMIPETNITLINDYFRANEGAAKVNMVICRQVLEHLEDPGAFMRAIRNALVDNGYAYLEVPSEPYISANAAVCDLHLAHVQYFSPQNFESLASEAGLRTEQILWLKNRHDFGILFRADHRQSPEARSRPQNCGLADRLKAQVAKGSAQLKKFDGRMALYGATWHSQSFLANWSDARTFDLVIDDNEGYANCALYSRNQKVPIVLPAAAVLADIRAVVVGAYLHDMVIATKLRQMGYQGAILSSRPEPVPKNAEGVISLFDES